MLGTNFCGLRSITGNQVDWICTMMPVAFEEHVVVVAQRDLPFSWLVWRERVRLFVSWLDSGRGGLPWRSAARNRSAIARTGRASGRLPASRRFSARPGVDVDQLDDEVAVGAGGRGEEIGGQSGPVTVRS
jgi:hypothetical protein